MHTSLAKASQRAMDQAPPQTQLHGSGVVVVALPCFNDASTLKTLIPEIRRIVPNAWVVVVDDGSEPPIKVADGDVTVLRHSKNRGLSAAMRTAARFALSIDARGMIKIDADGEMNPCHLPRFVNALDRGADAVIGTFLKEQTPWPILWDDWLFSRCFWLVTRRHPGSVLAEYRGFSRHALEHLSRFEGERYASPLNLFALRQLRWEPLTGVVAPRGYRRFPLQGMVQLRMHFLREVLRFPSVVTRCLLPVLAFVLLMHATFNLVFVRNLNGGRRCHGS